MRSQTNVGASAAQASWPASPMRKASGSDQTVVIAPDDSDCLEEPLNASQSQEGPAMSSLGWPMSAATQHHAASSMSLQQQQQQQQQPPQHHHHPQQIPTAKQVSTSLSQSSFDAPQPCVPLIEVAPRLYFAVFTEPLPHPDTLNAGAGTMAAVFPPEPPMSAGDHILRWWAAYHPEGVQPRPGLVQGWAPTQPLPQQFHWVTTELPYMDGDRAIPYEYLPFYDDWGPLNMSMLFLFCDHMASLMRNPALKDHGIVLYTSSDPIRKTNTAALVALRSVLALGQSPADAFYPFATMDFQPWRDAGYGRADFCLTLQDVVYGAWRAQQNGLFDLAKFNLEEYFYSELPANGDWNWITPSFIAFASPNDPVYVKRLRDGDSMVFTSDDERKQNEWNRRKTRLINDFAQRKVSLVVRLNNALYDKTIFEEAGIEHSDMYFDDGSNPTPEILKDFIDRADRVVESGNVVAVHCKAGLGRTGVLIGAYLVWKYGFNASEAIGWMRVQRPGCVVGPQQQYIYEQAQEWVKWGEQARATKRARAQLAQEHSQMAVTVAKLRSQLAEAQSVTASTAAALANTKKRKSASGEQELRSYRMDENTDPTMMRPFKSQTVLAVGSSSDVFASNHAARSNQPTPVPQTLSTSLHAEPRSTFATRPHTPVDPPSTAPRIKPTPCVGQPRKSPSPAHKRYVHHLAAGLSPRRVSSETRGSNSSTPASANQSALGLTDTAESIIRSRTSSNPLAQPARHASDLGTPNPSPERRTRQPLALSGSSGESSSADESDDQAHTPSHRPSHSQDNHINTPTRVNHSPSSVLSRSGSGRPTPVAPLAPTQSPAGKLGGGTFNLSSPIRRPRTPPRAQHAAPAGVLGDNKTLNIIRGSPGASAGNNNSKLAQEDVFGPKTPTGLGLGLSGGSSTPTRNVARASPTVKALYGLKDASTRAPPSPPPAALGHSTSTFRSPVRTRSRTMALNRTDNTNGPPSGGLFRPTVTTRTVRTTAQAASNDQSTTATTNRRPASRTGARSASTRRTASRRTASNSSVDSAGGSTVGARTRARHAAAAAAKSQTSTVGFGRGRGPLTNRTTRPPSALNL